MVGKAHKHPDFSALSQKIDPQWIVRTWRGLARYAIDGSTLRTSDTPENRQHFGAQVYASGVVASYP
ncbi:hypothetical protein, partial [Chromobacterium fluminis]|uniref:hypothetical protein n=1 Tax=Chromobacterium fluminis TaxID=3044269 RepID=UPI00197DF208